jgi:hypothetical protein
MWMPKLSFSLLNLSFSLPNLNWFGGFSQKALYSKVSNKVSNQVINVVSEKVKPRNRNMINISTPSHTSGIKQSFSIDTTQFESTGIRMAIMASSGNGKSYLGGVICEQILENKGVLVLIDPEGECFTLATQYPIMIVGKSRIPEPKAPESAKDKQHREAINAAIVKLDLTQATNEEIREILDAVLKGGISVIWDLSDEALDEIQQDIYTIIATQLRLAQIDQRKRITLVVDEAQTFAPQSIEGGKPKLINNYTYLSISKVLAKRGRKYGIDTIWLTQRPQSINKDILTQCNAFFFGCFQHPLDLKAIQVFMSAAGITDDNIKALKQGSFYFYSQATTLINKVGPRICKPGGGTPSSKNTRSASKEEVMSKIAAFNKKPKSSSISFNY